MVLKVDYEKAYDIVCWKFLRFCFNKNWILVRMEELNGGLRFQELNVNLSQWKCIKEFYYGEGI